MINLVGKVALVTGGASGLGRATVERLVKIGCYVAIVDLPTSSGKDFASKIHRKNCIFLPADVSCEHDVKYAVSEIINKWKKLDIAVNCAGVMFTGRTYSKSTQTSYPLTNFQRAVDIHVKGTFAVCSLAAKEMAKNTPGPSGERGVVINTASVAAFDGPGGTVAYSSAKGAIASMTLPMARDLAPCGIRVVTIAPGFFQTPIIKQISRKGAENNMADILFPSRLGDPDEFAHMVQSVMQNQMINGEVIRLDGGVRLQPGEKKLKKSFQDSKL